jgi:hypothetical protein
MLHPDLQLSYPCLQSSTHPDPCTSAHPHLHIHIQIPLPSQLACIIHPLFHHPNATSHIFTHLILTISDLFRCRDSCLSLRDMAVLTREYMAQTCSVILCAIHSYSYMMRSFPAQCAPCAHTSRASRCISARAWAPYSASHPDASIHCPPSPLVRIFPFLLLAYCSTFIFIMDPYLHISLHTYSVALRLRMTALRCLYKRQQYILLGTYFSYDFTFHLLFLQLTTYYSLTT